MSEPGEPESYLGDKNYRREILAELVTAAVNFRERAVIPQDVRREAPDIAEEAITVMREALWQTVENFVKRYGVM